MRISRDEWALRLAEVTAARGTCIREQVGCVLTDARGRVLATGYNGVAAGEPHCNEHVFGAHYASGVEGDSSYHRVSWPHACPELDDCRAVHAVQNTLVQCHDPDAILSCYVTTAPCVWCVRLLLSTGCRRIVFRKSDDASGKALWSRSLSYEWIHLPAEPAERSC
jgi:dCMP deaminase